MSLQERQDEIIAALSNILDKETLQKNITVTSLFVLFFETLKDYAIDKLRDLYCVESVQFKNGKFIYQENDRYKSHVRALDKDYFYASLKWFLNHDALTEKDVETVCRAQKRRNVFVHELFHMLFQGIQPEDMQLLTEMAEIYKKIDSWWVFNVEFDPDDVPNAEEVKQEDCFSSSAAMLSVIKDIALGNGEQYSDLIDHIKSAVEESRKKKSPSRHFKGVITNECQ